jgi:hypothetical protein
VTGHRSLRHELLILAGLRIGGPQLVQLPLEIFAFPAAAGLRLLQALHPLSRATPPRVCLGQALAAGAAPGGPGVEQPGVGLRLEEGLLLVLAVDRDQAPAPRGQLRHRQGGAVDARGAPAAHLASERH